MPARKTSPRAPIYLDHNATTPVLPEAVDAMLPFLERDFGNPSSGHVYGRRGHDAVETAREQVAALIGCKPSELVFTSGGTEANNLAIRGLTAARTRRHVITSVIEHPATARPVDWLGRNGFRVTRLGVDAGGQVDVAALERALGPDAALVTVMHSNNETGVLQPIARLAALAKKAGTLVHTDAAQSVGKVPVDARALGVDALSVAGHKLYAPKGVGALFVREGVPLEPLLLGAGHERGLRPGTENVASIVALGVAAKVARRDLAKVAKRLVTLRERLWDRLAKEVDGLALNGHPTERLPNTLSVRFPGVSGTALLDAAPTIAASTGSACHDGHETAPAVVVAMGVSAVDALGTVRLSLGRSTTKDEVDAAAKALGAAWRKLRSPR
jgi:cysteine desulfurase